MHASVSSPTMSPRSYQHCSRGVLGSNSNKSRSMLPNLESRWSLHLNIWTFRRRVLRLCFVCVREIWGEWSICFRSVSFYSVSVDDGPKRNHLESNSLWFHRKSKSSVLERHHGRPAQRSAWCGIQEDQFKFEIDGHRPWNHPQEYILDGDWNKNTQGAAMFLGESNWRYRVQIEHRLSGTFGLGKFGWGIHLN